MMVLAIGLAGGNSALLLGLIYLYAKIALRTKATYSLGFVLFAALLLLHNMLTLYAYATMAPLFGADALPYLSGIGLLELAGLGVLFRMTVHPS